MYGGAEQDFMYLFIFLFFRIRFKNFLKSNSPGRMGGGGCHQLYWLTLARICSRVWRFSLKGRRC